MTRWPQTVHTRRLLLLIKDDSANGRPMSLKIQIKGQVSTVLKKNKKHTPAALSLSAVTLRRHPSGGVGDAEILPTELWHVEADAARYI